MEHVKKGRELVRFLLCLENTWKKQRRGKYDHPLSGEVSQVPGMQLAFIVIPFLPFS